MRLDLPYLLALTAFCPQVFAIPSPYTFTDDVQHYARKNTVNRPIWRSISDKVIQKIWGLDDSVLENSKSAWRQPPSQTRSRHGEDLLLRFNISTANEATALAEVARYMYLDVWEFNEDWVDIRMAKTTLPHVLKSLPRSLEHAHTPLLQERELAQAIFDTYPSPQAALEPSLPYRDPTFGPSLRFKTTDDNLFFANYQPLSVIQPWLKLLGSLFTTHVRLISIGVTYEGRDIPAVRVGAHPTNDDSPSGPRKTILITGGIHAREWISTSTVNYIAYSLITGYGKNPFITKLVEDFDWVFVPTINPDGYVYTWENDRLWRKNRQRTPLRFCYGVDLDRSYGFEWDGQSTSGNPCSESYAGEAPFEGVESRALANWAINETTHNNAEFVGFLDLHSYSQQILYPYSYSCDAVPPSLENLEELGAGLAKSIRINNGHVFQVAAACEGNVAIAAQTGEDVNQQGSSRRILPRLESGGGSALDWFYHDLRVRYTYQIKLRDRGSYGFLLPKEHIVPSGKEMLDAVLYFGRYVGSMYDQDKVELQADQRAEKDSSREEVRVQDPLREGPLEAEVPNVQSDGAVGNEHSDEEGYFTDLRRRRKR